ncbi:MAG: 4-hydroxybutyrate dehydrogenase [Tissierellia bacterium]|nr:4-hydroxybutyrate dehydrogenase [Tissierellia bacterium]
MIQLKIKPLIYKYDTVKEFLEDFEVGKNDLVITNEYIFNPEKYGIDCHVLYQEKYGLGEPSDEMVEDMYNDIKHVDYARVIAIGGGTVIDVSKLFVLTNVSPVLDLYERKLEIKKSKELVLVPTTCGTGSEVTNIAILELKSRKTKMGLAVDEMYADSAVLIPELLYNLPFKVFATSSIDALIHAIEAYVSPKATPYTEMYSIEAMKLIVDGYNKIRDNGQEARIAILEDYLIASNYAGIAFANAGVGAVHAMSYPLGATHHVPHGESNYAIFTGVFKAYQRLNPDGKISKLNCFLAELLNCEVERVYEELENLLNVILPKKPLREYGTTLEELEEFTENVMTKQGRLTANNYTELNREEVYNIYKSLL